MAGSAILVVKSKFVDLCGNLSSSISRGAAPPPKQDDGQNGNKSGDRSGNAQAVSPNECVGRKMWRAEGERMQRFLCNSSSN